MRLTSSLKSVLAGIVTIQSGCTTEIQDESGNPTGESIVQGKSNSVMNEQKADPASQKSIRPKNREETDDLSNHDESDPNVYTGDESGDEREDNLSEWDVATSLEVESLEEKGRNTNKGRVIPIFALGSGSSGATKSALAHAQTEISECIADLNTFLEESREQSPTEWFDIRWSEGALSDGYEDESNVLPVSRVSKRQGESTSRAVLKYRSNCNGLTMSNLLEKNHAFMTRLDSLSVTVKSLFLSPEAIVDSDSVSMRGLVFPGGIEGCSGAKIRFQVMERFGQSIRDQIRTDGKPFRVHAALKIAHKVLDLLSRIHGEGIVHGDVNWANVLIDEKTGNVRLVDFDRSREINNPSDTDYYSETRPVFVEYRSPSQLKGVAESVAYSDDIYGVYELIGAMTKGDELYMEMRMNRDKLIPFKRETKYIEIAMESLEGVTLANNAKRDCDFHQAVHDQISDMLPDHEFLKACINQMIALIDKKKKI